MSTGNNSIIRTEALTKRVPLGRTELTILDGIDMSIHNGEAVAIVGESGSGKTTLLGLLAGLDVPTEGHVWLGSEKISELSEDKRALVRAQLVGFVFQSFQLIDSLTTLENVMLPGELRGDSTARSDALQNLERVGLGERTSHYPRQLSGGEQQRVAIARAFASNPEVLFADEPTGNLDTETGHKVAELLFDMNDELRTTLVLVTHDVSLSERCHRTYEMSAGKFVA